MFSFFFVCSYSYSLNLILGLRSGLGASIFAIVIQKKKRKKKGEPFGINDCIYPCRMVHFKLTCEGLLLPTVIIITDVSLILFSMKFSAQGYNPYHFRRLLLEMKRRIFFGLPEWRHTFESSEGTFSIIISFSLYLIFLVSIVKKSPLTHRRCALTGNYHNLQHLFINYCSPGFGPTCQKVYH